VWACIGGFGSLETWHPAVTACDVESDDNGDVRTLTLGDGSRIVERLDAHNNEARSYTYTILEAGPLPVQDYQSTINVTGHGAVAKVKWTSKFSARGASEADAQAAISGVYTGGFAALIQKFGAA
jgi:hypothetical protein